MSDSVVQMRDASREQVETPATPDAATPGSPPPPLESRRIRMRPIGEGDRRFLYELMSEPEAGGRVRFGGATPSPEKVAASLWDSVLAQFVVTDRSGVPIGLVAITSPDFRNGFAYVSALGTPEAQGSGLVAEAVFLAFNYAFLTWPFRKIYMEATEDSFKAFAAGLDSMFTEEGRMAEHVFWNGRYVDVHIVAVYRNVWQRMAPRLGRLLTRRAEERS